MRSLSEIKFMEMENFALWKERGCCGFYYFKHFKNNLLENIICIVK